MAKAINGLAIVQFDPVDKLWYSFIKEQVKEVDFGAVEIKLTIKSGKIVALKIIRENTLNLNNII